MHCEHALLSQPSPDTRPSRHWGKNTQITHVTAGAMSGLESGSNNPAVKQQLHTQGNSQLKSEAERLNHLHTLHSSAPQREREKTESASLLWWRRIHTETDGADDNLIKCHKQSERSLRSCWEAEPGSTEGTEHHVTCTKAEHHKVNLETSSDR